MLDALLYLLIGAGALLSAAGLLYGLGSPRRPRLIVGAIALALLVSGLWRLEAGKMPFSLPRHIVAVVACKPGALETAASAAASLPNVASLSFVQFDDGTGAGCPFLAANATPFAGANLPIDSEALPMLAGVANRNECDLETSGVAAIDRLNDIACGVQQALDSRGLLFRTRTPAVVLFLETEDQLGTIPRAATNMEANVRQTLGILLDQDVPISTRYIAESLSIGRTATLETRNDLASEIWSARTVFVLTLQDEALAGIDETPPYLLQGTFRKLGGPNCDTVTDFVTRYYPQLENWQSNLGQQLVRRGERPEQVQITFNASHLMDPEHLRMPRFVCDGWIRLEVEASLLVDGEEISFPLSAEFFRQKPVPSATLIESGAAGRLSDSTWYGLSGSAPGAIEIIQRLATDKNIVSQSGYLQEAPLVYSDCSFAMPALEDGTRSATDLAECIARTEALVLVEPTADDLAWLEARLGLADFLRQRGHAVSVIGPPAMASPPAWLRTANADVASGERIEVHREQVVHFVPDRGLLARAEPNGIRNQQDVIDAIAKRPEFRACGSTDRVAGIIEDSDDHFGLERRTLVRLPAAGYGARFDMTGPPHAAHYSRYSTAPGDFGAPSLKPYVASHALLQLANFVLDEGGADAWRSSRRQATSVVLFATNVWQADIGALGLLADEKARIRELLSAFFASGAKVIVVELPTGYIDGSELNRYLSNNGARSGSAGPYRAVLDYATSIGSPRQVAQATLDANQIAARIGNSTGRMGRVAFGRGFDSEMDCVGSDSALCGNPAANAERAAPERHVLLTPTDPLDASRVATNDRDETIYTEHHYGRSRIHTLGWSPFARDFVERDTLTTPVSPGGSAQMLDRCFLDQGKLEEPDRDVDPYVRQWVDGWGFTRLIDLVRHSGADIVAEQDGQIVAIDEAANGQSVDIIVRARPESGWPEPLASEGYSIAPIDYDPIARLATFRVNRHPDSPNADQALTIEAMGHVEQVAVKLQPLETSFRGFEIWRRVAEMSSGTGSLYGSTETTVGRYGVASLSMLVLAFTLIILSPLTRRWTGFLGVVRRLFERQKSGELKTVAISSFSVEAVLSEWGANPGEAATGRHAGIPLGIRTAQQDDSLASVIWADLAGLVAPDSFPFKKPRVRLRSLSQTKESVVIVDDSGALRYPSPLWHSERTHGYGGQVLSIRTGKSDFAARLAAVVAQGLRMTGAVKLITASAVTLVEEIQPDTDSALLTDTIRERLDTSFRKFSIHREQFNDDESNRLAFLIADPLCTPVENIEKLAERMSADGGELRLALVVSESDRNPASLMLDLSSSGFIDRTEWTRHELSVAMDQRIEQIRTVVNAHGARLAVLDPDMTSSEVLAVIRDQGLLD